MICCLFTCLWFSLIMVLFQFNWSYLDMHMNEYWCTVNFMIQRCVKCLPLVHTLLFTWVWYWLIWLDFIFVNYAFNAQFNLSQIYKLSIWFSSGVDLIIFSMDLLWFVYGWGLMQIWAFNFGSQVVIWFSFGVNSVQSIQNWFICIIHKLWSNSGASSV